MSFTIIIIIFISSFILQADKPLQITQKQRKIKLRIGFESYNKRKHIRRITDEERIKLLNNNNSDNNINNNKLIYIAQQVFKSEVNGALLELTKSWTVKC